MKQGRKIVSAVLSFCLVTMLVPATAFAEVGEEASVSAGVQEPAAAASVESGAATGENTLASTDTLESPVAAFAAAGEEAGGAAADSGEEAPASTEVPENLRLSDLRFASGSYFAWSTKYEIEGGFDPANSDVNLIINASGRGIALHATPAAGVTGEITAEYTDANGDAQSVVVDPEADENKAASLDLVEQASYEPIDFTIKIGGETAYTVHIKRRATVSGVSVENVRLDDVTIGTTTHIAYFNENAYEYTAKTADRTFSITPSVGSGQDESKMIVTGGGTVTPEWDENGRADVVITAADKEGKAVASTYTFHVQYYDEALAQAVVDKINAIGTVDLSKEAQITEARADYDALPSILQPKVTNIATLEDAELALNGLKYSDGCLADVIVGSGWSASSPEPIYMTPAFDSSVRDYEVYRSGNVNSLVVTLKDGQDVPLSVSYTNCYTGVREENNLTSGQRFYPSGMIGNMEYGPVSFMVSAGEQLYRFTVYRVPAADSLSLISGAKTIELFDKSSGLGGKMGQSFSANVDPSNSLSAACTYFGDALTAAVTAPEWANHQAQVTVSVAYDSRPEAKPYQASVTLNEIPSKVEILKAPDKTMYRLGESLDATGMEVRATYANGDTVTVNNDDLVLEPVGLNKMRVSYHGASAEQDITIALSFSGAGTQEDPYVISTTDQIDDFAFAVNAGESFEGKYFALGANVTLPTNWKPAGCMIDESLKSIKAGENINPFSGVFDGKGYTLTVPAGQKPLFGYVRGATVKNLNIYGTSINGCGLINNMEGVGLSGNAVTIDNVTILSGSTISGSGLLSYTRTESPYAGASAGYVSTITNCTIEEGVTVGSNSLDDVGSFAGRFQGTIENCESSAKVRGGSFVGGIIGCRDNAMGTVTVKDCAFHGTVQTANSSAAKNAGGIIGGTYDDGSQNSAPNGIRANIIGNVCDGTIKGKNNVGGILGGDSIAQEWNTYVFKDNVFKGDIARGNAESTGAIIGYYRSLNSNDDISNNTYELDCSTAVAGIKAVGRVDYVDTNNAAILAQFAQGEYSATIDGTLYFNTEKNTRGCPTVQWCSWRTGLNRTDDPLGADSNALFSVIGPEFEVTTALASDASADAAKVGDTVTVNVIATANRGVAALEGTLDYDPAVLELVSVAQGADLSEGVSFLPADDAAEAHFSFVNNETAARGGIVVATATFKALKAVDDAVVTVKDATAALSGDALDYQATMGAAATFDVRADALLGDANGNGHVNIVDAQVVYDMACGRYGDDYAQLVLPADWSKATLLWAANVNGDDAIDAVDAFAIQRFMHYGAWQ